MGLRGLNLDQRCPVCNSGSKSINHLLHDCPHSISFWNHLDPPSSLIHTFGLPISDWLLTNCTSKLASRHHHIPWHLLFLFGIWSIWLNRNKVALQYTQSEPKLLKECIAKALEYHFLTSTPLSHVPKAWARCNWIKPPSGLFKLNTDASVIDHKVGGGGLIYDSEGRWVEGFTKYIGTTSVLMAELWALRDGIHMAKHLHIHNLVIKVDSAEAINLLSSPSNSNRLTQPLVNDCRDTFQAFQRVHLLHCYREANRATDSLAKIGCA